MNPTTIQSEIVKTIDACYDDPRKPRRMSLRRLREESGRPCTAEAMIDTLTEAKAVMNELKAEGRVTWFGIVQLNAGGPEWIRFTLPPAYARQSVPSALDSAADGQ